MAKKILCVILLTLTLALVLASCGHEHEWSEWQTTKEATCTTEGLKERVCECGEKETQTIHMTEHTYGEWATVKAATSTEKGSEERICTCGKKETRDIDMLPVVTVVTADEWKSSFDFSKYNKFTLNVSELCSEDDETYGIRGTIKVENGIAFNDLIIFYDTEEDIESGYESGIISSLEDFYTDWLCEFQWEIDDKYDYGYALFAYSDDTASYYNSFDIDGVMCGVNVYFNDTKIVKITFSGGSATTSINCTYTFTYN